jgi:hypothetical protein
LTGITVALKVVLVVYVSECAPYENRGTVCIMLSSGVAILQLIVQPLFLTEVFGNQHDWFLIPLFNLILAVIHLIFGSFLPPSPKHLYLNLHQEENARHAIKFYQGRAAQTSKHF